MRRLYGCLFVQNKKDAHLLVTQTSCQGLRQSQDGGDAQGQDLFQACPCGEARDYDHDHSSPCGLSRQVSSQRRQRGLRWLRSGVSRRLPVALGKMSFCARPGLPILKSHLVENRTRYLLLHSGSCVFFSVLVFLLFFACYICSAASLFFVFFLEIFCGLFLDCC